MKRHSIIARLGPADNGPVKVLQKDSLQTEIRFVDGYRTLGFDLGHMVVQLRAQGAVPSENGIDLTLLAATVTAADTRISREEDAQDSWTREIDLYVPVHDPQLWNSLEALIARTLKFLTGDHWRLFFRERHATYAQLVKPPATSLHAQFTSICLFSGGLDSFVGAIDLLANGQKPLLVSHYGDNSTSSQPICAQRLAKSYGKIAHVRANVRFDRNDFAHLMADESTTRGRSFLFLALAALAASGLRQRGVIYVPENGLISVNVPLDSLRLGAWSTRTTHPFYIARWQTILDALGIPGTLENPYRFKTKGEMLAGCANVTVVRAHLGNTISCSSVTKARWLGRAPEHCGFCVPCLIRRAAVASAFGRDTTSYTIANLSAQPLDSKGAQGEHVRSFQMMARRLAGKPDLASVLVHKSGPLADYSVAEIAQYADVFRRGINEVDQETGTVVVRPL